MEPGKHIRPLVTVVIAQRRTIVLRDTCRSKDDATIARLA